MTSSPDRGPGRFPEGRIVLVTGAAGFIGTHLCRGLAVAGARVRAVDIAEDSPGTGGRNVRYLRLDIRDRGAMASAVDGVDTVFHLASVHLDVHASPEAFETVNVEAAGQLVELCAERAVRRLVHCSSVGIHGHVTDPPADEEAPAAPETAYERTKLAGERLVLERGRELGMDIVVIRPAWVYGPGCPRTAKLLSAVGKGRFFFVGDGSNLRHPLYIDDMVRAFLLAGAAPPSVAGRAYIIGGPRSMPSREMVETCATVLKVAPPRFRIPRGVGRALGLGTELAGKLLRRQPPFSRRSLAFFENDNAFDISRAARELGFVPEVDLEEGLRRTRESGGRTDGKGARSPDAESRKGDVADQVGGGRPPREPRSLRGLPGADRGEAPVAFAPPPAPVPGPSNPGRRMR